MRSKSKLLGAVALVFAGIIFGAILVSGFGWVRPSFADVKLGASKPPVQLNADATAFSQAFIEVAEKVTPSIVQVKVVSEGKQTVPEDHPFFFFRFPDNAPREQQGAGSGIIISDDGYILTNNHVVQDAKRITVALHDRRELEGKLIGTDPLTDLAVIKINADNLPEAFLGDSEKLKVGQWVMAIGNPLSLASTVTSGIISALNRGIQIIEDSYGVEDFIQTDAVINPGNSGGALVDLNGSVIGINTAIATRTGTYMGYGFAIPINLARSVAKDLIAHGSVSRGYIGVQIREVDAALSRSLGMETPTGVIIERVVEGGSAASEDIKVGDVILKVDERIVNQPNQLQSYIAAKPAGTKVKLELWRDGKKIDRTVTLKARDGEETETAKKEVEKETKKDSEEITSLDFEVVGLTVRNMTEQEKTQFKIESGVMISNVKAFSRAADQGLSRGLVISKADRKNVNNVAELKKIFDDKKGSAVLLVVVDSQQNSRFVGLEIPQ